MKIASYHNTVGTTAYEQDHLIQSALESLETVIESAGKLSSKEQEMLQSELQELKKMRQKLENCSIEIVAFGEVSTGKSSVLNALLNRNIFSTSAVHGETKEVTHADWDSDVHCQELPGNSQIRLVDTPGLNEVKGSHRARMAREMSLRSDLILFITDSDLNQVEHQALMELGEAHKPIIVVLNKVDIMSEKQLKETMCSIIQRKLPAQVSKDDLILTAADPKEREVLIVRGNKETTEIRKSAPDVQLLKQRIFEYLKNDGKALVALNASLFTADVNEKIINSKIALRRKEAETVIWKYAIVKALAVAVNPVPVIDMAGAASADLSMIYHLGHIYGFEVTKWDAIRLWKQVIAGNLPLFGIEWLTHMLSSGVKVSTYLTSTLITAPPQALAAAWASYILGQATRTYYANNASWGAGGPKTVIQNIFKHVDDSLIKQKLGKIINDKLKSKRSYIQKFFWEK